MAPVLAGRWLTDLSGSCNAALQLCAPSMARAAPTTLKQQRSHADTMPVRAERRCRRELLAAARCMCSWEPLGAERDLGCA